LRVTSRGLGDVYKRQPKYPFMKTLIGPKALMLLFIMNVLQM
jgi:hypothetical protein